MLCTCGVSITGLLTVSHAGIATPFLLMCAPFAPTFHGRCGTWGTPARFSVLGVGLELMRVAVAPSSERTYQGHFGAWADFRVRCGVPVFLQPCNEGLSNVWQLFEYVTYSFATKKLRSATIESHLSAIKFFSIGFRAVSSLTPPTPFSPVPSKGLLGPTLMWVTRLLCVGPCGGPCGLLASR